MIVLSEPDFLALPPHLAALFTAAGTQSFFSQAGWYSIMTRRAREPGSQIRVYADSDRPTAALVCRTDGDRRLQGLANFYSVEHGPIFGDADASNAIAGLAGEIAGESRSRELFRLSALDPGDIAFGALARGLKAAGWMVKPHFEFGVWFEDTRGCDFSRYFAARPGELRHTYRRRLARARTHRLDFRLADGHSDISSLIADYEEIYRQSWKESEPFPDFMPELIRWSFSLGALRMGVIRIDDVPAAAQFWILWQGRAVIYKLAHDQRYDALSPGTLLTMRMFEHVLESDRPNEVNFGRGDDPYKKMWLPRRRERWGLVAANPRTLAGLRLGLRGVAAGLRDRIAAAHRGVNAR